MKINILKINELIKKKIKNFNNKSKIKYYGKVISVFDGICHIYGLYNVMQGELLKFSKNIYGLVLNLEENFISAIIFGEYRNICEGDKVESTNDILKIKVGYKLCGRVINALGKPIDGKKKINLNIKYPIENNSPGVIYRKSISKPLYTGIKSIDSMIPIGKGQRELIIGDRQTGKTSIAIDTIINQKNKNVFCIYVAIGQKMSSIKNIVNILKKNKAMKYTIIIAASASESASMQYISAYSGCAIGEYFRDLGNDALIIYDDLSKHAISYRQISLLLRRPPGREAYPGDIFYLHSRLLERAACINFKYIKKINKNNKKKTGSLTAMPIIETQLGDVSSFIPTNIISITDGQIFLETSLFNSGIRPAINPSISVSRVGGAAQNKIIKKLSSGIRTSLAQYKELESFSQFTSELDLKTKKLLNRGIRIIEILKQDRYKPISFSLLAINLYFLNKNYFDDIKIKKILIFEKYLHKYIIYNYKEILKKIKKKKNFNKKIKNLLNKIILEFKNSNFYKKLFL